jgi:hypothetical protein
MAKAKTEEQMELSLSGQQQVAVIDFGSDLGAGLENTSADSFAVPFLMVLQSNSPYCVQGEAKYIAEARPGMLLNTITSKLYDGSRGVLFVPVAYRRVFLCWAPRQAESGPGFKGEFSADEIAKMRAERRVLEFEGRLYEPMSDGSINPKRCNRFSDTRLHYGILADEETAETMPVLLSLTSTQIKKSKHLMSALVAVRVTLNDGRKVQPPTFANLVRVTTVPESNDQGNWFGVKFAIERQVSDQTLYASAKSFHDSVLKGSVAANYSEQQQQPAETENAF